MSDKPIRADVMINPITKETRIFLVIGTSANELTDGDACTVIDKLQSCITYMADRNG